MRQEPAPASPSGEAKIRGLSGPCQKFSKVIALVYLLNKTHRVLARICTAPCRWASGLELAVRLGENSEKSVP
jgi:hypothetical protein